MFCTSNIDFFFLLIILEFVSHVHFLKFFLLIFAIRKNPVCSVTNLNFSVLSIDYNADQFLSIYETNSFARVSKKCLHPLVFAVGSKAYPDSYECS